MARIDNVDLDKVKAFAEQIKSDPQKARKTQVIEGEWLLEGGVQFRSLISFEGGQTTFEIDSPTFLGGSGTLPGPLHYCFYGLASCYTATFATMAAMLGINLKKLTTRVEADINFSQVFGVSDQPITEEVRVKLNVDSDASEEKIREAEQLTIQRCPVVFSLRNPIKFTPSLEIFKAAA